MTESSLSYAKTEDKPGAVRIPVFHEINSPIVVPVLKLEWSDFVFWIAWLMFFFIISMLLVTATGTWGWAFVLGGVGVAGSILILKSSHRLYEVFGGIPKEGVLTDALIYYLFDRRKMPGRGVSSPWWCETVGWEFYQAAPVVEELTDEEVKLISEFVGEQQ